MKPTILILTGYGLNCEAESAHAWRLAGAEPRLAHLNDVIEDPTLLRDAQGLMLMGGFSYGDHLGSGLVFANRLRTKLREELQAFIERGRIVLGVCNGFQILTQLGMLPGLKGDYFAPTVALQQNECGSFQNFWVTLRFEEKSPCVFTRGLTSMELPIRHGEGRLFTADRAALNQLQRKHLVPCRYADPATGKATMKFPHNPNGSEKAIAGLCDETGRIFGLMPHPEAYLHPENHPQWDFQEVRGALPETGQGLALFSNAVEFLKNA
ncbi:MAG: phosphoribosylformylglycinamidine synthase subunit PurQ [Verrucomicrobia bacterium]|nr:phosphoribosylformylglycinamidine synthase subunit PurQ [Kiritimatiellia bacterium]MCO6399955.1 phosphoribosylformylglycinamidine synthase subunit PurQ [Verrucomicrobiota bacterium]